MSGWSRWTTQPTTVWSKGAGSMEYTKLGNSDLTVSRICMGCMGFGDPHNGQHSWTLDEGHSREIIQRGLELGVNFFDTAIGYQSGTSEQYLGRALRDFAKREDVVVATKFLPRTQEEIAAGVSVTLDFPQALAGNSLDRINEQGFACQIWRINPDDGQKQVILESERPLPEGARTVDHQQALFNSVWTVSLAPLQPWYLRAGLWLEAAVSLLIALLAAAGIYYAGRLRQLQEEKSRRAIQQLQEQLEQEQGNMLMSQIRSHFFYHTLNALQALIVLKPEAAYKMAGDFARYLRFTLDSVTADGGIGSFREELRAVRAYADINQQQLGDRLHMVYEIPDADFPIPLLTIQPLVENAILHGIKPKVGGGTVTLRLEELPNSWKVTVSDDGVGFDLDAVLETGSIGLENVRRRMARFPGSELRITSAVGAGTQAVLLYGKQAQAAENLSRSP